MSRLIYVRNTDNARRHGLGGHAGYVESTRADGTLRVCVRDLDGGLAGPFDLTEDDVIDQQANVTVTNHGTGEVIEPRDPSTLSPDTLRRITEGVQRYSGAVAPKTDTLEGKMRNLLFENCLSPDQIDSIMQLAKEHDALKPFGNRWSDNPSGYEASLLASVWHCIRKVALAYLEEHWPMHIARTMLDDEVTQ